MRLFYIFPLKGPTNGVKVISKSILEKLLQEKQINTKIVDTSQATEYKDFGKLNFSKITFIFKVLWSIRDAKKKDIAYMNFSTKGFSFYRDLIILSYLNFKKTNTTLHIHANGLENCKNIFFRRSINKSKIIVINSKQLEQLNHYKNVFYLKNVLPDYYKGNFEILEETKETKETKELLYFSNLSIPKGIDLLRLICEDIYKNKSNFKLIVCGGVLDIYSQRILDELIKKFTFIQYLGAIEEEATKMELLKNSDYLLFLSHINYEVYPLVYIEALMNGLPIITTPQIVATEVIANNCGFLLTNQIIDEQINDFESAIKRYKNRLLIRERFETQYCFNDYYNNLKKIIFS